MCWSHVVKRIKHMSDFLLLQVSPRANTFRVENPKIWRVNDVKVEIYSRFADANKSTVQGQV